MMAAFKPAGPPPTTTHLPLLPAAGTAAGGLDELPDTHAVLHVVTLPALRALGNDAGWLHRCWQAPEVQWGCSAGACVLQGNRPACARCWGLIIAKLGKCALQPVRCA